jgi:hypothetical protein
MMAAYATNGVEYCKSRFDLDLDYSESSVEFVEAALGALHEQIPRGFVSKIFRRGPPPEVIDQLAKMLGGYVGEVMRRQWGGTWKSGSGAFPGALVYTLEIPGKGDVWPHLKAGKRIVNGPEDNVWHYYQLLK